MKTFILDKDDVRSRASGYHLNVWDGILDAFGLSSDTDHIEIVNSADIPAIKPGTSFLPVTFEQLQNMLNDAIAEEELRKGCEIALKLTGSIAELLYKEKADRQNFIMACIPQKVWDALPDNHAIKG